jgi:VWFA-related protein
MRLARIRDPLLLAGSLFCLLPLVFAQSIPPGPVAVAAVPSSESPQPSQPPSVPPIRKIADEVSFDLIVQGKHHKPVLDLRPSDLAVTDNGAPVDLSALHLVTGGAQQEHLVTLIFDRLDPGAARYARSLALKILGVIPDKGYSMAVLQINGRLRLVQAYTANRRLAESAIAAATPQFPAAPSNDLNPAEKALIAATHSDSLTPGSGGRADAALLVSGMQQFQRIEAERPANPSLAALQALIVSERERSGRKLILYFSEGIQANADNRDTVRSIVALANRAGVNLCAVDTVSVNQQAGRRMQAAQAISMLGNGGALGGTNPPASGFTPGAAMLPAMANDTTNYQFGDPGIDQSPLIPLAAGTGGVYISASNRVRRQLQQLHDDLTNYYEASWVPAIKDYDGQFRPVSVRPLRKGLLIRARAGYFALPPSETFGIRPFEVPLLNLLAGPRLPTAIAFHSAVLHLGELPDGNSAELAVEVPVSQLQVREDANTHISSVHASVVAVIRDDKGAVLQTFGDDFPLHESPDRLRLDPDQVITLERHFSADPGTYTLETAVLDRLGNQAGAQRSTFTIDPAPPGPSLSDMALVRTVEPLPEETQTFEPMHYLNGRVVPNLAGELPEDTRSLSLFFLIHPLAGSTQQPSLVLEIDRNRHLLTHIPVELHPVSGSGGAIPYLGTLRAAAFPPGQYQVRAILTQDSRTASSTASFAIEGTIAASNAPNPTVTAESGAPDGTIDSSLADRASTGNSRFVFVTPANPLPPPTPSAMHDMLEAARSRALAWSDSLQNFFCMEVTDHSVDETGRGDWKHKDTLVERMRYIDHIETRTTLSLNGEPSTLQPDQFQFAHSSGEFGAMFHIVFDPAAKTAFTWRQSELIDGQLVQVFAFKVDRAHSTFQLSDRDNRQLPVGFHGLLYVDPATRSVRRITVDADDIPPALKIRASSISVDYSWITMNNHDFLLPVRGAVSLQESKSRPVLNEFEFRDYRLFGSQIRMLLPGQSKSSPQK